MTKRSAVSLCAAMVLALAVPRFALADDKTPDKVQHDARLDQRITISVIYDSLEEFCARPGGLTGGNNPTSVLPAGGEEGRESPGGPGSHGAAAAGVASSTRSAGSGRASAEPALSIAKGQAVPPAPASGAAEEHPVEITCDPAIKDHKVVVRVREQPLREVMRQVAELFDFTWMQGPQEHPRYHLTQSAGRAKLAEDLRKRYVDERTARAKGVLKDAIRAAAASDDELRELARVDPEAVATAVMAGDNSVRTALGALDDAALDRLADGEEVALSFSVLSAEAQRAVKERLMVAIESRSWLGEGENGRQGLSREDYEARRERLLAGLSEWEQGWGWDQAFVRFKLSHGMQERLVMMDLDVEPVGGVANPAKGWSYSVLQLNSSPWSGYAHTLSLAEDGRYHDQFANDERYRRLQSLWRDYGINVTEQARQEDAEVVPAWARPKPAAQAPQASRQTVAIKPEHYWMPELLLQAAETLDISLVADCYWTYAPTDHPRAHSSQLAPLYPSQTGGGHVYLVDANPDYTLQRLCERRAYGWVKDGEFYRARNLLWFVDDPDEVPASALNEWMRRTKMENEISVEDYIWAVGVLTERHANNLQWTRYKKGEPLVLEYPMSSGFYWAMKLYAALPEGLRRVAEASGLNFATEIPQDLAPIAKKVWDPESRGRPSDFQKMSQEEYREFFAGLRLWAGYRTCEGWEPISISKDGKKRRYFFIELWSADAKPDWNDTTPLPANAEPKELFHRCWYHLYDVGPDGKPQKRE